jgi:hypothetical protein
MATSQEDWQRLLGELQQGMKQKLSGLDQMQVKDRCCVDGAVC